MPCWVKRACGLDSSVRSECQMPAVLSLLQSVVEHFADERIQQPAMYLVPNALFGQACLRFGQFRRQPPQLLRHSAERSGSAVELFAGKASRIFEHTDRKS